MKNQQKVFVIILVVFLLITGIFYVYENKKIDIYRSANIQSNQGTSTISVSQSKTKGSTLAQNSKIISKFSIVYPNGGENIKIGDKVDITWNNSSISNKKNITIYLIQNLSGCFNLKPEQTCLAVIDPETVIASDIYNNGLYSWIPKDKGTYYLKICVDAEKTIDSCDLSDELFIINDPVEMANKAPSISNITGPTNLKVNENGVWTINATDPEKQKVSYSMSVTQTQKNSSKIVGIKPVDPYSSVINWKFDKVGTYLLEFTASDFYGKTSTLNIVVTVQ